MMAAGIAVSMRNISIAYGSGKKRQEALRGITGNIEAGGITGVMGPDAAGKTTLLRVLAGLLVPDSGQVEIFGQPLSKFKKANPNAIGYMPQRFGLYEDLTVEDNLELYASLAGLTDERRQSVFAQLLKFTSLAPFVKRLAGNLSGGMKQKLGIACALLGQPRLLLLDEPGVGVDPRSRLELWEMVGKLSASGTTVLWATSYMDEAAKCPRLIVLEKGAALFEGKPAELADRALGCVYLLPDTAGAPEKRAAMIKWSQTPGIDDVTIQGDFIRLEVGGPEAQKARSRITAQGGKATAPTLGDAYMAAVGGIDKRPSPYAAISHIGAPENRDSRIVARGLTKKFGDFTAVDDISFKVAAGEIAGLLGPNGAGKSTTFRMLCGLLRPTAGQCSVDGVDMLASSTQARSRLGYMAQKFSLYQDISVWQNIYISARLYGLTGEYIRAFGQEMAESLGLGPYLKTRSGSLPLGMKQRLSLLCATIHKPPVLFLDEPTSGVDIRTRREFWKHIAALTKAGAAVLVTTHFMEESEYCDNIALIYRGHMIRYGSPVALASGVPGLKEPDMEKAFIAYIEQYDREHPRT